MIHKHPYHVGPGAVPLRRVVASVFSFTERRLLHLHKFGATEDSTDGTEKEQDQQQNQPRQPKMTPGGDGASLKPTWEEELEKQGGGTVGRMQRQYNHTLSQTVHHLGPRFSRGVNIATRLAFPAIGLTEFAVRHSIGRIPGINILSKGRDAIVGGAERVAKLPVDAVEEATFVTENVAQGITQSVTPDSRQLGRFKRLRERLYEGVGQLIQKPLEFAKYVGGAGLNLLKATGGGLATAASGYANWVAKNPWVGVPLTLIGGSVLASQGPAGVFAIFQGIANHIYTWATSAPVPAVP